VDRFFESAGVEGRVICIILCHGRGLSRPHHVFLSYITDRTDAGMDNIQGVRQTASHLIAMALEPYLLQDVDARDKPGNDGAA